MIAIFVSRDEDEFNLYPADEGWFPKPKQLMQKGRGLGCRRISRLHARWREIPQLDKSGDRLLLVVINGGFDGKSRFLEAVKQAVAGEELNNARSSFIKYIDDRLAEFGCAPSEKDRVFLFVHWGGGGERDGVAQLDRLFQDQWAQVGRDKWALGTISSRRSEIFDLNRISLPRTCRSVEDLMFRLTRETDRLTFSKKLVGLDDLIERCAARTELRTIFRNVKLSFIPSSGVRATIDLTYCLAYLAEQLGATVCKVAPLDGEHGDVNVDEWGKLEEFNGWSIFVGMSSVVDDGFRVPPEFALIYDECQENSVECRLLGLICRLAQRVKVWKIIGLPFVGRECLHDWCMGAFRRLVLLDEDAHGNAGRIDEQEVRLKPLEAFRLWQGQLVRRLKSVAADAWSDVFPIKEKLQNRFDQDPLRVAKDYVCDCWDTLFDNTVPSGTAIAYATPAGRIKVLLVDDDAQKQKAAMLGCDEINRSCCIEALTVASQGQETVVVQLLRALRDYGCEHRSFDVVLLDLRLKDACGEDPSGYQLIRLVRQFMPVTPIVVFSRYDDMGHMSRAFKQGADWFIRKDEIQKLPRHIASLMAFRRWKAEWRKIQDLGLCSAGDFIKSSGEKYEEFWDRFDECRRYLTYKSLEKFPGRQMAICPMSGGFSTAATFRVTKGSSCDGVFLQTPVIVKIDRLFNTMTEHERYFRFIRPYLANESGRVESRAISLDVENSSIVYTYAGKNSSSGRLLTLRRLLEQDVMNETRCCFKRYEPLLDELFDNILRRIHHVSPELECGGTSACSSYPNVILGEREAMKLGFVGNYLSRMAIARHYRVVRFFPEVMAGEHIRRVEFRSIMMDGNVMKIEGLEIDDCGDGDYSKMTVVLTGDVVDHFARYRSSMLMSGQTLYVEVEGDGMLVQDMELTRHLDNALSESNSSLMGGGVERFMDDYRSLLDKRVAQADFDTIVVDLYRQARDLCANDPDRFECPVGIIHGDLNLANIMLDRREEGCERYDVWLIDFARSRRDIIAHDFNVLFTSIVAQMFRNDLWRDDVYVKRVKHVFVRFMTDAVFGEGASDAEINKTQPAYLAEDRRLMLLFLILRRIRCAAFSAGVKSDVYAMTTALCCLYAFRIFIKYEKSVQGGAALLAITHLCLERLHKMDSVKKESERYAS